MKHFGEIVLKRVNTNIFLEMNFEIRDNKKIDIETKDKIQESIYRFGERLNRILSSPVSKHLWDTNEECEQLSEYKKYIFFL